MKSFSLIILLSFFLLTYCEKNKQDDSLRSVMSGNGLILRDTPSRSGQKILVIKNGRQIKLTGEKGPRETIEDKEGQWVSVTYEDKTGWVFDAYLSK